MFVCVSEKRLRYNNDCLHKLKIVFLSVIDYKCYGVMKRKVSEVLRGGEEVSYRDIHSHLKK